MGPIELLQKEILGQENPGRRRLGSDGDDLEEMLLKWNTGLLAMTVCMSYDVYGGYEWINALVQNTAKPTSIALSPEVLCFVGYIWISLLILFSGACIKVCRKANANPQPFVNLAGATMVIRYFTFAVATADVTYETIHVVSQVENHTVNALTVTFLVVGVLGMIGSFVLGKRSIVAQLRGCCTRTETQKL